MMMKKDSGYESIWLLYLLSLAFVAIATSLEDGSLRTYIVQTSASKMPSSYDDSELWYSSLLNSLHDLDQEQDGSQTILYNYNQVFHGFAARLTPAQAEILQKTEGILAVNPDMTYQLHTTRTPHFLGLNAVDGAWSSQSEKSSDLVIGLLDSGIWPESPSFADYGMKPVPSKWKGECESGTDFNASHCNKKLVGARFFCMGYEVAAGPINETEEYRSPRDQAGHGTHTASTAAGTFVKNASLFGNAMGTASGMAPGARIAVYKVCWARGCMSSDILAAMNRAVEDGVDILSLSLGGKQNEAYESDTIAVGAFTAMQKGIFVSCSGGNSGPDQMSVQNVAPWITTVGASTLDRDFPGSLVLGNRVRFNGVSLYRGRGLLRGKLFPIIYASNGTNGSDLCLENSLDPKLVKDKIVMCDRGTNARVQKGFVVKSAGGVGMILSNTEDSGEDLAADSHILPAIAVGFKARESIKKYIKENRARATIQLKGTVLDTTPAPVVAGFSSRGPNFLTPQILKPDIVAPGVNILAAWTGAAAPSNLDMDKRRVKFNIISGTSMSCPHVSGIAALIKDAHPDWSPAAIRSALITTAYSLDNTGKPLKDAATGFDSTPFAHGAGHVDPNRALNPGLIYDMGVQDYVDFLCSLNYTAQQLKIIANSNVSCSSNAYIGNINYPSFSAVFSDSNTSSAQVLKYMRTVTNVEDRASTYKVAVSAPAGVSITVSPTTLSFAKVNEKLSYTVTFTTATSALPPTYGSITWSNGVHNVRSPVAAFSWQA